MVYMHPPHPLPILTLQQLGLETHLEFVQRILQSSPSIFATTGQSGTGKLTTLLAIVNEFTKSGSPVKLFTEDLNFPFVLPENWSIQVVIPTETAWAEAIENSIQDSSIPFVIDILNLRNYQEVFLAAQQKRWIFTCIDTPYIGIDVVYNFRDSFGTNYQELLQNFSCIWSQTLLPLLCVNCAQPVQVGVEAMKLLDPNTHRAEELWKEVGCEICEQRGTNKRGAVYEILQIDDETRPILQDYLENNIITPLPSTKHQTIQDFARSLLRSGKVGIETYKRFITQNPMLRVQHLLEHEKYRSAQMQDMFSRFVTRQVVDRIMHSSDFAEIVAGERRKVTCVFCDVRNFTSYAETASPDDIFALLNSYFQDIIEIVFKYEGTIDKFIGDSIMLVFGAPTEQEDQEIRAVSCAIAFQHKVAEINATRTNTNIINLGIGINTGEVIAGCLGSERRMDYTVLGDVVNVAARLESRAIARQILISAETCMAVQDKIPCRSVGDLALKGKSERLSAFEVVYE
ncbi:adenylate/guanylate cyclase domain-containing protein [Pseudanabaena sp. ABRG5-3]|uniref:adenylate/guanylate cyclase domain-containing protein n=1 Tax=Pseudanabaena sp. ABRG5-3 TaxID=685565 RepID=UPI000DC6FEE3|nr:adenylate/guanylate cyclase domain-containing protein [Pseudanabaena sp. ABRG5-3]BBC22478.1 adenylate/guanylate cyclase [Pseudanabaena sp. ABRG5-3]